MKTNCYCTSCKNHPKHEQRAFLGFPPVGYAADKHPPEFEFEQHAAVVDCLKPVCFAIEDGAIDPDDFLFPITAYGDGASETGFYYQGCLTLLANCGNEDHEN